MTVYEEGGRCRNARVRQEGREGNEEQGYTPRSAGVQQEE